MWAVLGILCWKERGPIRLERVQLAGVHVMCAYVPRGGQRGKRLVRAAKLLRRAGVRRMLENGEEQPDLPGLPVVDALPLYRAVTDRLVLAALSRRGIPPERASVVLRGEYPDSDLTAAARSLCPRVRQVVVDTDRGGEVLQRRLLLGFGVAVTPVRDRRDVLTVRFSGAGRGESLILCNRAELDGLVVDAPQLVLPEMLARPSALCALWQAGLLNLSQIRVVSQAEGNKCT